MAGELTTTQVPRSILETPVPHAVGHFRFTGVTVDQDTVTIEGRNYEFDVNGVGLDGGGDVSCDVTLGASAAQSAAALVAAINGDGARVVDALAVGGSLDVVALIALNEGDTPSLVSGFANCTVSAANMVGGSQDGFPNSDFVVENKVITAEDVLCVAPPGGQDGAIPVLGIGSTTEPTLLSMVWDDAGVQKDVSEMTNGTFTWAQVNTNYWALMFDDGAGADVAANDELHFICLVN